MLTPKQKAKYADGVASKKDAPPAVAPCSGPATSGLSLPRAQPVTLGNYTVVQGRRAIGAGSFGQALEVQHNTSGRRMTLKMFHDADTGKSELRAYGVLGRAVRDARLHEAACPFLRIHDFCEVPPIMWMVMPLIGSGDLWKQLKSRRITRREASNIMHDAWVALQFMHEKAQLLHLDIKPQNMLWTGDHAKLYIIDFSLWERWPVPAKHQLMQDYCTPGFRPPELVNRPRPMTQQRLREVVRPTVDLWSLGVVGACLAWSGIAEPGHRPMMQTAEWHDCGVCKRHLDLVSPAGTYLRPVLDKLLDMKPDRRCIEVAEAESLFGGMKERAIDLSVESLVERLHKELNTPDVVQIT